MILLVGQTTLNSRKKNKKKNLIFLLVLTSDGESASGLFKTSLFNHNLTPSWYLSFFGSMVNNCWWISNFNFSHGRIKGTWYNTSINIRLSFWVLMQQANSLLVECLIGNWSSWCHILKEHQLGNEHHWFKHFTLMLMKGFLLDGEIFGTDLTQITSEMSLQWSLQWKLAAEPCHGF